MLPFMNRLLKDLSALTLGYSISIQDNYRLFCIHDFLLPPDYNRYTCEILVEIPHDYPLTPPGVVPNRIYLPNELRFQGRRLQDYYDFHVPGLGKWSWLCFQQIDWDSKRDNWISLMEIVRTRLTNPPTI